MRKLILGVTGMLGNAVFRLLGCQAEYDVWGTMRGTTVPERSSGGQAGAKIFFGVDVENNDTLLRIFSSFKPEVVINCVGVVKQLAGAYDPLQVLPINSLLPHRLALHCGAISAKLIHISTDCVFDGAKGNYLESDISNATDLYGKSKFIGELTGSGTVTLRTSIIGHELSSRHGLIEWFLSQSGSVRGFTKAYFSGLPTVELAMIIRDYVIPTKELSGLYHVSAARISKYQLLMQVAETYKKSIEIIPDDFLELDRSLNGNRFRDATGYESQEWATLIQKMFDFQ